MQIEFRKIDKSNYEKCISLKVSEKQESFVAPNTYSLVQAAYEPEMFPLGIYYNDIIVGFILYDYDEEIKGWSMSRFMIDIKHQKQGIGEKSLEAFILFFKKKYKNLPLFTSAEVENTIAINLYEKYGFIKKEEFKYTHDNKVYHEVRMVNNFE